MGKLELIMYQRQFQARIKEKMFLKELVDIAHSDQTKAFWELQSKNKFKKILRVLFRK